MNWWVPAALATALSISAPLEPLAADLYVPVARVVDGDTIQLATGERVRLIGVDTPETVHPRKPVERFGREAAAFTRRMLDGRSVRLEYDWPRKDRFGRILAYVFLRDGTFVNAEIIRQGYGFAFTKYPFRHLKEFRQLEREARAARRGLWAEPPRTSRPAVRPQRPPLACARRRGPGCAGTPRSARCHRLRRCYSPGAIY